MVARLFGAPMALGELEGLLVEREAGFRDLVVGAEEVRFEPQEGRMVVGGERMGLQAQALDQVAARLRVPANYLRRCPPELVARNLNHWLEREDGKVLVRVDGDEVRAVLSERYRPVSHVEVVREILRVCGEEVPVRWELDATRLALQVIQPKAERTLLGGISGENSETGHCTVSLSALIYRVICTNGLILAGGMSTVRRRHTHEATATLAEVRSTVEQAWPTVSAHADRFEAMRRIRALPIESVFERINTQNALSGAQVDAVREAYRVEPGSTLFDVINAYTRAGNSPTLPLAERTELQAVGGRILTAAEGGQRWI